jgi:integrase
MWQQTLLTLAAMTKGASVYQRAGRKVWYVSYFCPKALRRLHVATPWPADDNGKKKALRFAEEKAKEAQALGRAAKREAWSVWVPAFMRERYVRSPLTLKRYENAYDWLCVYLDKKGVALPAALSYEHVIGYVPWRITVKRACGKPISRNTAIVELKFLGLVMREAVRRGFAISNPCDRLGIVRDPAKKKPELTDAEIAVIREALKKKEGSLPLAEQWMTTSFEIALHTLCRLSSTSVPMGSVDLERGEITLRTKGRKIGQPSYLTIPIHPALRPRLEALRAAGATHTCILPRMAAKEWWELRKELGLAHTTFHSTRVTGITRLWRDGVPETITMRIAGHRSPAVHEIYLRTRTNDLAKHLAGLNFSGAIGGTPQTPGAPSPKP